MSRAHAALLLLTAACGRVAFDPLANVAPDAAEDSMISSACPVSVVAPDPLQISGTTFEYTTFQNAWTAVPGASLDVVDDQLDVIATTVSDAAGAYALSVATGGAPKTAIVQAVATGFFKTVIAADVPFAVDTTGAGQPLWSLGDVPLWAGTNMMQIYSTAGLTREEARGTLNVAVRDCDGNPLEDVAVTLDPAPDANGAARYQAADGRPSTTLTMTALPFAHVLVFNAFAGPTKITASRQGVVFSELTVNVAAGQVNTLTLIRGAVQ